MRLGKSVVRDFFSGLLPGRAVAITIKNARKKTQTKVCAEKLERMMGVEPTSQAWEARILPMYYTRILQYPIIIHSESGRCQVIWVFLRKKCYFNN